MQNNILDRATEYLRKHRRMRIWKNILVGLASIVVFCTTYALIIPAITMENGPTCGKTAHQHEEACYEVVEINNCTFEGHIHEETCYDENGELLCTLPDAAEHVHTEECILVKRGEIICGLKEHEHDDRMCYIDVTVDVETEADWKKTIPAQLTGDWRQDLTEVAKSQLSYSESYYNIEVDEDGQIYPYTRYGQWKGVPYAAWNNLFVGFCLNYAQVDEAEFPWIKEIGRWIDTLGEKKLYEKNIWEYEPLPGDIAFLDTDGDGKADRTGIVAKYKAPVSKEKDSDENIPGKLTVIEGDTDNYTVEYVEYKIPLSAEDAERKNNDLEVLGYACLPEQTFYCGQKGHVHGAGCKNDAGEVKCGQDVHIHTKECKTKASEQEKDIKNTLPAKTGDENATSVLESETTTIGAEETTTAVEREETVTTLEEEKTVTTADLPEEDIVHDEGSVNGTYMHSKTYEYYQFASHENTAGSIKTYVLIPGSSEEGWTPDVKEWSAKKKANYMVAYCAECFIESVGGTVYDAYVIDNSRFATPELRRNLAGVIAHSYPYLTYEEMQAELKDAYINGEIAVDVSGCSASAYMAAVQAAIWELITPSIPYNTFKYVNHSSKDPSCVNPLKEFGHTDKETVQAHCDAITQWLKKQIVPDDLKVEQYDYTVEKNEYELYTLTVKGRFNRSIIAGEIVGLQMSAGTQKTDCYQMETGNSEFQLVLAELTEKELSDAEVSINLQGKRMQAYYFENPSKQDMIGGQWESYEEDLSFKVAADSTEVCVTKYWAEEAPDGLGVKVQLYANGVQVRETAELNAQNQWTYTFKALEKTDALGNPIQYTVRETPMTGYYSDIQLLDGENKTIPLWEKIDTTEGLKAGGQYMLIANAGALESNDTGLYWGNAYPENVNACSQSVIWTAQEAGDGNVYLYNNASGLPIGLYSKLNDVSGVYTSVVLTSKETDRIAFSYKTISNEDGSQSKDCLSGSYGENEDLHFVYIRDGGIGNLSNAFHRAAEFTVYKLVEREVPPAEINYYITNTKIREDVPLTDVTVIKEWKGRPDDTYPEYTMVQLLQNGKEYDIPVELNQENGWTAIYPNLPKTDNDGNLFEYSVIEIGPDGYSATQNAGTGEGETYQITLINTWNPENAPVILQKADFNNQEELLPGAEFMLYLATNNAGEVIPGTEETCGILFGGPITVGEEGSIELMLPVNETYYLVETKAPDGYEQYNEPIGFTVTKRGSLVELVQLKESEMTEMTAGTTAVITVKNRAGYELPKTGGAGINSYIMGGLTMMLTAGVLLLYKKQKRGREER